MGEPFDDDSTVIRPASEGSYRQMSDAGPAAHVNALPVGTVLGEFELTDVIGEGGFSIVYLAWDRSLKRRVALKEYIPASLATRSVDLRVTVRSERHRDTFEAGLKSFINEAQLLAQFDHPSLVKVYRFWEDRGTAFMVMPWYQGPTLKAALRTRAASPDEAWLLRLLDPLTEALSVLHAEHCFHRDVAPDNIILLGAAEAPLLLDFGAARRVIAGMTHTPTVILKAGFGPLEQYDEVPGMQQGPWTDVYALAAVVYYAICGRTPPTAVGRLVTDTYVPLTQCAAGRYSARFLSAIDRALAVRPEHRTPSMAALRDELGLAELGSAGPAKPPARAQRPVPPDSPRDGYADRSGVSASEVHGSGTAPTLARSRRWFLPAAICVALVAAGAVVWRLTPGSAGPETGTVASASTPMVGPSASVASAAPEVSSTPMQPMTNPGGDPTLPSPLSEPFMPARELDELVAAATPGFEVEAGADRTVLRIGRDRLAFHVRSSRDGYVYVLVLGPDGALTRLYPNPRALSNRIRAGEVVKLPTNAWSIDTVEPVGIERFFVIVSERPRDFRRLERKSEGGMAVLDTDRLAQNLARQEPGRRIYAGRPVCDPSQACSDEYGAATFALEVVR